MNGETQAQDVLKPPRVKDGWPNLEDLPTRERISIPLIVATIITTILTAAVLVSFFTNKAVQWPIVIGYLFDGRILHGVLTTIEITAMAMALGLVIAVTIALMRLSKSKLLRTVAQAYTWLFRAMPLLVLLILTYNFALFYPEVGIGIPTGPMWWSAPSTDLLTPILAAVIAFALNEGAYSSEILRASILSVPRGQEEAAVALGMTKARVYRRVVLPQAIRIAIPPIFNNLINMLKGTSIVAFIGVFDLMYTVQSIYQISYEIAPLLVVATIWYLVVVTILTFVQSALESRFAFTRSNSLRRRILSNAFGGRS
ncbi:amino acid ABC transporter permease [Saccharopolyspora phatthalungensis]|uniref:Polar amino acid transport system permease protein n=1 Tax=Saccharopolyspora phatthalungensis TaxID=664693 RepID=A0A840QEN2_9PSEU|nr:amino acid ABC transporter permease [Saccharopolyspora phatthalungensis]MBB5156945.1 polar amino acid transport system permease protein [Saccharopolyspora phatthalungensis]